MEEARKKAEEEKPRKKSETPKTHKRSKKKYNNNPHLALNSVCEKTGLQPKDFKGGKHTEKQFIFIEK
mgnify:CR=1 FL=1